MLVPLDAGIPPFPPGESILSNQESDSLFNFMNNYVDNNPLQEPFQFGGLNFSEHWLDLPPKILGGETTLGTPASGVSTTLYGQTQYPLAEPISIQPAHLSLSLDEYQAASFLSQPSGAYYGQSYGAPGIGPPITTQPQQQPSLTPAPAQVLTYNSIAPDRQRPSVDQGSDFTLTQMLVGTNQPRSMPQPPGLPVQYGSDPNFNRPTFVPQSYHESTEGLEEQQRRLILECFERNESTAPTRVSSPLLRNAVPGGDISPHKLNARLADEQSREGENAAAPPAKRRKSEPEDNQDHRTSGPLSDETPAKTKRRKSTKMEASQDSPPLITEGSTTPPKRRKGGNNSRKTPRANLTEEQKRNNHIKSEQKRRTLIQDGFNNLKIIVPGIDAGGQSKNCQLQATAKFIQELLLQNEDLERQIAARRRNA